MEPLFWLWVAEWVWIILKWLGVAVVVRTPWEEATQSCLSQIWSRIWGLYTIYLLSSLCKFLLQISLMTQNVQKSELFHLLPVQDSYLHVGHQVDYWKVTLFCYILLSGVRDTDCPAHGLCCYDGCANSCYSKIEQSQSSQKPVILLKPVKLVPPNNNYIPVQPLPPKEANVTTTQAPHIYPPKITKRYEITTPKPVPTLPPILQQPFVPLSSTTCPPATPLSFNQCAGRCKH